MTENNQLDELIKKAIKDANKPCTEFVFTTTPEYNKQFEDALRECATFKIVEPKDSPDNPLEGDRL